MTSLNNRRQLNDNDLQPNSVCYARSKNFTWKLRACYGYLRENIYNWFAQSAIPPAQTWRPPMEDFLEMVLTRPAGTITWEVWSINFPTNTFDLQLIYCLGARNKGQLLFKGSVVEKCLRTTVFGYWKNEHMLGGLGVNWTWIESCFLSKYNSNFSSISGFCKSTNFNSNLICDSWVT